jgi:hypothetical protein
MGLKEDMMSLTAFFFLAICLNLQQRKDAVFIGKDNYPSHKDAF